ncbi:MAG: isoaspartyl peptidase/L-asparaginase [Verrucomicrobiales bacterium]|nr:isoaspartyl peptidase/L-asparaginase [Verrucomicrobiales bacterium]
MYKLLPLALLALAMTTESASPVAIVIHGGAGRMVKAKLTPARQKEYHTTLEASLRAGHAILKKSGSSLDAVQAAIIVMEDSPLFNAGKGAVFTSEGRNELDASLMDGLTLEAGAVGGVTTLKNPILAARAVMDHTPHVLLTNQGAEAFAKNMRLELVKPNYFYTDHRWRQLQEWKKKKAEGKNTFLDGKHADYFGTVGCVALDAKGNIAAGTSTGGLTGKQFGRIGDSPIIGAGTYANNKTCGISCTGHGEYFIRYAVAHDISAHMEYKNSTLAEAARDIVQIKLKKAKGSGGIIGLDAKGNIVMEFNTPAMNRGSIDKNGKLTTGIFK